MSQWDHCAGKPRAVTSPYSPYDIPPDEPADFSFKVLVIGDSDVGKTSFISRFCNGEFRERVRGTIGLDLKKRTFQVDGKTIRLLAWDTAGQERYRTLTTTFYRGVTGVIILFDVTREATFDHVTNWLDDIAVNVSRDICKVMVGNKSDCNASKKFPNKRVYTLADSFMIPFMEVSAKTGQNVEVAFEELTKQMISCYERKISVTRCLPRPSHLDKIILTTKKKDIFSTCSC